MGLSQEEIFALGTLIHDHQGKPGRFEQANWVGWCPRGHVILSGAGRYQYPCTTLVDKNAGSLGVGADWQPCRQFYNPMPNQDTLLAAFRLGGWDAMVEAAQAMIASG